MSTVRASTIQDRATGKSLGIERVVEGTPKSWASVNGYSAPASIAASFNASSVSDLGLGQYQVNYSALLTGPGAAYSTSDAWLSQMAGWPAESCLVRLANTAFQFADGWANTETHGRLA